MRRLKLDVLGVGEVRWTGVGSVELPEGGCFIYSGGQEHKHGVGVLLNKHAEGCLAGFYAVSERVILIRLKGKPFDVCIIQVYAPTCDYSDEEVEGFYGDVAKAKHQCKPHDIVLILGDLNAKVGRGRFGEIVGPYGVGERNERGDKWVEWCVENELVILNTWFRHHPRKLWTWRSPGDHYRNQIDYITINKRFRNIVTNARTYPGADCNSDHAPVVVDIRLKLKKPKKKKRKTKINVKMLNDSALQSIYSVTVRNKYDAMMSLEEGTEAVAADKQYSAFKEAIDTANREILPKVAREPKRPWMTDQILNMMDERRMSKSTDITKYKDLNRKIHRECLRARIAWMTERCEEIEELEKTDMQQMYSKVKEIKGRKQRYKNNISIKKADSTVAMEIEDVKERWSEYIEDLFRDQRPDSLNLSLNDEGPGIMNEEVRLAVKSMKKGKAVGEDGVALEMIIALGDFGIEELTKLFNRIYNTGNFVKCMCESVFIALPKVEGTLECGKHRTISIISQVTKIMLRVILKRIRSKIRPEISEEQFGFVSGKGTRNAIFCLRTLSERCIEIQKSLYICFIDYEKAFDKVKHGELLRVLRDLHLDGRDLRLIENLYWNQTAAVRVGDELTEWQEIRRGVRQGCVLSPDLFNIYSEMIMRELEGLEGVRVGGRNITNIRYADDTALIADSETKMQSLVNTLVIESQRRGLKVNFSKTKVMVVRKGSEQIDARITIDGSNLEQVNSFSYLGSILTEEGRCEKEIKTRISIAKDSFNKIRNLVTNQSISVGLRIRFVKAYAWSTFLYGCEAWNINKAMEKRIEALEMWFYRRIMRISWVDHVSNERVLQRAGARREMLTSIRKRQLRFLGHVMREEQLESVCLMGKVDGRRGRGRPRIKFVDGLARVVGGNLSPARMLQLTRSRLEWRRMIDNVPWDTSLR